MKTAKAKAKVLAWTAFSKYIRQKGVREDGMIKCYTCGKRKDFKEMSAGHGIGGRNGAILFLEEIVKPQCAGCNIFGRGQYQVFTRKLIDELGLTRYDEIVTESRIIKKFTVADYMAIEDTYKKKVDEILKGGE